MTWKLQARLLLRKANQDAVIVRKSVTDPEIPDEVVGFHFQQGCEKSMKAVLAWYGVPYRKTHDLQELYDLLEDNQIKVPTKLEETVEWSPFAIEYRYEDWSDDAGVDRERAHSLLTLVIEWCESVIL